MTVWGSCDVGHLAGDLFVQSDTHSIFSRGCARSLIKSGLHSAKWDLAPSLVTRYIVIQFGCLVTSHYHIGPFCHKSARRWFGFFSLGRFCKKCPSSSIVPSWMMQ
jgi:hypothetical protein